MGISQKKYKNFRGGSRAQRIIATIFSIAELILAVRFLLELLGANANNSLVQGLYTITQPFVGLFEGIFAAMNTNIFGIQGIFEPATVIAVVVLSLIEWALFRLMSRQSGSNHARVA